MTEQQEQQLIAKAQIGGDVREFVKSAGFQIIKKFIEDKVTDARKEWLKAPTAQDAEIIRIKTAPYAEIEAYLKRLIIEGEVASEALRQNS